MKQKTLREKREMLRAFIIKKSHSGKDRNFLGINPNYIYVEKDVKEAVEKLKEEMGWLCEEDWYKFKEEFDKIFGEFK